MENQFGEVCSGCQLTDFVHQYFGAFQSGFCVGDIDVPPFTAGYSLTELWTISPAFHIAMSKQEINWAVDKMTRSVGFLIMEVVMPALWVCQRTETAALGLQRRVRWRTDNLPRMPMSLPHYNEIKMRAVGCSNNLATDLLRSMLPGYAAWVRAYFSGCGDMAELHSQNRLNPETRRPLTSLVTQAAKMLWVQRRRMYAQDEMSTLLRFKDFKATILGHFIKEAIWLLLDLTVDLLPVGKRSAAADKTQGPDLDMAKELLVGGIYYNVTDFTVQAIEMAARQRAFRALPFSGMDSDDIEQECVSVPKSTATSRDSSESDIPLSSSSSSSRRSSLSLSSSQETAACLDMALSEAQPKSTRRLSWRTRFFPFCRRTRNAEAPYAAEVKSDVHTTPAQNIRRRPSFTSRVASGLSKLFCCCRRQ